MSDTKEETLSQEVVVNPGRERVYEMIATAVNNSDGDPAQTFMDAFTAAVVIGHIAQIDMTGLKFQEMLNQLEVGAKAAAKILIKEMTGETDGG